MLELKKIVEDAFAIKEAQTLEVHIPWK